MERTSNKLNEESPYFCCQRLFAVMREEGEGGEGKEEREVKKRESREVERERERERERGLSEEMRW